MSRAKEDKIRSSTADKKTGIIEFDSPDPKLIELFHNKYHERDYVIEMETSNVCAASIEKQLLTL